MNKIKTAGVCVFCGELGVTKQHVFPDWLRHVIPRVGQSHDQHLILGVPNYESNVFFVAPAIRRSRGPLLARKIRKVCKSCNSGWMSQLETGAKDILTKMILDEPVVLDIESQTRISTWAAMTCTMAEFTDTKSAAVSEGQRASLMKNMLPPVGWSVFIGRSTEEDFAYSHTGSAMMTEGSKPPGSAVTQTSTFKIGAMLVHALSSTLFDTAILPNKLPIHLQRVWPLENESLYWPPNYTVEARELAVLKGSHFEYFHGLQI